MKDKHSNKRARHCDESRSDNKHRSGNRGRSNQRSYKSHRPKKSRSRSRRKKKKKRDSKDDYDNDRDNEGHFDGCAGDFLGPHEIISQCGVGTFGKVYACKDTKKDRIVALKVVRKIKRYTASAKIEADILRKVNKADHDGKSLNVRMLDFFHHEGHACLVFERLEDSLYDFIKANSHQPFRLHVVQHILQQMLHAISFLHTMNLVHTDLKPENILFVDGSYIVRSSGSREPIHSDVKVIDFGGATFETDHKSRIIQTRQYRAPEVVMGLGWGMPADVWSIGCIIMELCTGELLFATHDNLEHLALMRYCLGSMPKHMSLKCRKYFHASDGVIRYPEKSTSRRSRDCVKEMPTLETLVDDIFHDWGQDSGTRASRDCQEAFLELLTGLLTCDPSRRWTSSKALRHRFFEEVVRK